MGLGFPKIRGNFSGGPYNKDYRIWSLYWGPTNLGKLPYRNFSYESLHGEGCSKNPFKGGSSSLKGDPHTKGNLPDGHLEDRYFEQLLLILKILHDLSIL